MIKRAKGFFFISPSNLSDKFYVEENPEPCWENSEKQSK